MHNIAEVHELDPVPQIDHKDELSLEHCGIQEHCEISAMTPPQINSDAMNNSIKMNVVTQWR